MKKFLRPSLAALIACLLALPVIAGCAWSIGDKGETQVKPTRGQELIDLKRAHEQGAISDAEYQTQKQNLLGK